ncbi:MAG TPA: hypothetical protein VFP41_10515 [Actinomycetota bacterium]|nr:hypothetical protein [Actinomycetota bacterium]
MNRWYIAALLTLVLTFLLVRTIPSGCDDGVFSCDGIMVAHIVVVSIGCVITGVLRVAGFVRSTK